MALTVVSRLRRAVTLAPSLPQVVSPLPQAALFFQWYHWYRIRHRRDYSRLSLLAISSGISQWLTHADFVSSGFLSTNRWVRLSS